MNEREEANGQFVVTGGYAAKVLELIEHSLDEIALFVESCVIGTLSQTMPSGRNDRLWAGVDQHVTIITSIGQNDIGAITLQQRQGLREIVGLIGRQKESQGITQRIAQGVNLGTETSLQRPKAWSCCPRLLQPRADGLAQWSSRS